MRRYKRIRFGVLAALTCGVLLGADYTWEEAGGDKDWTTELNWSRSPGSLPIYPQQNTVTVLFPHSASAPWECNKDENVTVGEVTIMDDTSFTGDNEINAGRLVFDGSEGAFTLTVEDGTINGNK